MSDSRYAGQTSGCIRGHALARLACSIAPLACEPNDPCVRIRRTLPSVFDVDLVRVEQLELETGGGRDTVFTPPLTGVVQLLDGGGPDLGDVGVDFFPVNDL